MLLTVDEANTDVWVFLGEMVGKMLCTVYRAVLALRMFGVAKVWMRAVWIVVDLCIVR